LGIGKVKLAIAYLTSLFVILSDQISKVLAMGYLVPFESKPIWPFFSFTLAFNSGSAFSFLASTGAWHTWFFVGFSGLVSLAIACWMFRLNHTKQVFALSLILGGALGNLIDRLRLGHVIDFIDLHIGVYHWPVFNLADTAICIGALGLALLWGREA